MNNLSLNQQGLGLLDAMNKVYNEKNWKMETFEDECQKWLLFLLGFVNYSQTPEISLHEFISSEHYNVTRRHQTFISGQVCVMGGATLAAWDMWEQQAADRADRV